MTAELKKWRRIFYGLSLHPNKSIRKFQREKYLFITLSIVYIQISNTHLLEFLITSKLTLYKCVVNVCIQR